jgi:hypothetical protein
MSYSKVRGGMGSLGYSTLSQPGGCSQSPVQGGSQVCFHPHERSVATARGCVEVPSTPCRFANEAGATFCCPDWTSRPSGGSGGSSGGEEPAETTPSGGKTATEGWADAFTTPFSDVGKAVTDAIEGVIDEVLPTSEGDEGANWFERNRGALTAGSLVLGVLTLGYFVMKGRRA